MIETEEKRAGEREKMERIRDGGKTREFKEREMGAEKERERLRSIESEKEGEQERNEDCQGERRRRQKGGDPERL